MTVTVNDIVTTDLVVKPSTTVVLFVITVTQPSLP